MKGNSVITPFREFSGQVFAASSLLFVPGSRSDRFGKAREASAGLTVIDLEDAVAPSDKHEARKAAMKAVVDDRYGLAIRINAVTTRAGIADLHELADSSPLPAFLLVPMVECATELGVIRGALGEACPHLIPLVETPRGLRHALAIASADKVAALMFGGGDFSGELGVALAWEPLLAARQQIVLACAEARIPAIDVPFVGLDDEQGLRTECEQARAMGFAAKAAIHPRQVATIEKTFEPSERECTEAAEALKAYEAGGQKAIRHHGRMLEAPLVKHYRAILARKERNAHA